MRNVTHEPEHRPVTPPEWTPPPGLPGIPPTPPVPPRPERPPTLPMILTPDPAHGADAVDAQLLRRRIVMLTGPLDAIAAEHATAKLLLLNEQGRDPITMHVSCPDADLDAALTLVATIDMLDAPVTAVAAGTIEGPAVAVYAAARTRIAHPHATFVLREPRGELNGDAERLRIAAEHHRRKVESLHDRVASATGRDRAEIARDMEEGRLLSADAARDYGLVESLTEPR